jgi:hypothetical protein
MMVSLLVLRRFSDHFFIQTLPVLSMATGWFIVRSIGIMSLRPITTGGVLSAVMILAAVLAERNAFSAAFETIIKREFDGIAHWGDRTATIAAALRDRLSPADEIFVFGRTLGVYAATERRPPTRFPFVMHFWMGFSPADGDEEMLDILERRPAFIVVDDLWLPNTLATPEPRRDRITAILHTAIARDYVLDGRVTRFMSWGGGFVGGGVGATVFRRPNIAAFEATASLQYTQDP